MLINEAGEADFHEHCSIAFFGIKQAPLLAYSFNQMTELAKNIVKRSIAVPGVQPKLSLSLVNETLTQRAKNRLTVVGAMGGNYIFKPPTENFPEMPQNEHLSMRMAEAFGIKTVKSSLIKLQSGELSYISKRIDRTDSGEKIHMLDMFQIVEANDKYKSSMEKIGKALAHYSTNTLLDILYFFEISVFSFLTGNNDMHLMRPCKSYKQYFQFTSYQRARARPKTRAWAGPVGGGFLGLDFFGYFFGQCKKVTKLAMSNENAN